MSGPSFLSVAQWDRREERCPGRATERCERDFLRLVLRVSNSNEIRERIAMIEPSKGLHDWPYGVPFEYEQTTSRIRRLRHP